MFVILFGVCTLSIIFALAESAAVVAPADFAGGVLVWLLQLAAVVLIFTSQSAPYYRRRAGRATVRLTGAAAPYQPAQTRGLAPAAWAFCYARLGPHVLPVRHVFQVCREPRGI